MSDDAHLSIRAKHHVKKNFYKSWEEFNKNRLGKVTQGDFLNHILKIAKQHIPEIRGE